MTHFSYSTSQRSFLGFLPELCLALCVLGVSISHAEEPKDKAKPAAKEPAEILAGHSYHGEVFNEGPRQKAYLMAGTGKVHFPITTKNAEVQKFFDQGLGQLHGFWYLEAERSFRHAASLDPECAMTYWGAALANLRNAKRSKGFIEEAIKRKKTASAREVMYIDAIQAYIKADKKKSKERNDAYMKALENIILKHPDDLEAKAILALHLYSSRSGSTSYFAVNALIEDILEVEPLHPVHHFRIHLWDHRNPESALASAARCGQSSPSIAHMWHMPGHIYSRLKRYNDAVWQQEASARVDHAFMMRDRVMPDEIHNFAHNNEWLIRNLIFVGRVHDAVDLAKNMIELPRHPKYNTLEKRGSSNYGRRRLFQVLTTYEMWDELFALAQTPYLEATSVKTEQVTHLGHLGSAYFRTGDLENGDIQLAEIERRLAAEKLKQETAVAAATEKVNPEKPVEAKKPTDKAKPAQKKKPAKNKQAEEKLKKQTDKAIADAKKKFSTKIKELERQSNTLKGHRAIAKEEYKAGYDLLKKAGRVDAILLAQAQSLSGEKDKAVEAIRKHVNSHKNEVQPRAFLIETLWKSDKKDEAKQEFEKLREISGPIDLDVPAFSRLAPIAQELGFPEDWRVELVASTDTGVRPELDSLGPFRWSPSAAPEWKLADADGKFRASKEFQGKPHVVIFYLGFGCLHCAEQLQAFAPKMKKFEKAGLSMIAISTDDVKGLKVSIDNYDKGKMPIPLVSNDKLDVFKAFRVFDNFEDQPLHGTFVIDAQGKVLWQDISYEPFMDPDFVLREATRLLSQKSDNAQLVSESK